MTELLEVLEHVRADLRAVADADATVQWDVRDCILYALSVGARPPEDLDLVYEVEGPAVLPTMATRFAAAPLGRLVERFAAEGHPTSMFATRVTGLRPLAPQGLLRCEASLGAYENRGKNLIVTLDVVGRDATGTTFEVTHALWVGGAAVPGAPDHRDPERPPLDPADAVTWTTEVRPEQYAVFRLQEDLSRPGPPDIHIDPDLARAAGLERPTLIGECLLGITYRAVRASFAPLEEPVEIDVRYLRPTYPGEDVLVELWEVEGDIFAEVHSNATVVATATVRRDPASSMASRAADVDAPAWGDR